MTDQSPSPRPEFSRPIDTTRLPAGEATVAIAATAGECAALARRFGLLALGRLDGKVRLGRLAGEFVRLTADFSADIVQSCVVTLEPIASRVDEHFTLLYGATEDGGDVVLSEEEEVVEPLLGGVIDIGEAVAQQLSLVIDPYPRAKGAAADPPATAAEAEPVSPFAVLARLREKK